MLTLIISILISAIAVIAGVSASISLGAIIAGGVAGFLIPNVAIGFVVRKKTAKFNEEIQEIMLKGQKQINHKINQFQNKPGADPRLMQRKIEHDQQEIFKRALDYVQNLEPLRRWNVLMGKQIATMRLQMLYQLKEYEQVDTLFNAGFFDRPILIEPLPIAMKMARQYKKKDIEAIEKTFKKHIKWFRGDRGTLLYGLLSWVYVKSGDIEKARQLLLKGKEKTGSEVLSNNVIQLANGKKNKFSNAGLGEEWYGLYLENPPAPKQKRVRGNQKGMRPF